MSVFLIFRGESELHFPHFVSHSIPAFIPSPTSTSSSSIDFSRQFPSCAVCTTPHPTPAPEPPHINHKFTQSWKNREKRPPKPANNGQPQVKFSCLNQGKEKKGRISRSGWVRAGASSSPWGGEPVCGHRSPQARPGWNEERSRHGLKKRGRPGWKKSRRGPRGGLARPCPQAPSQPPRPCLPVNWEGNHLQEC